MFDNDAVVAAWDAFPNDDLIDALETTRRIIHQFVGAGFPDDHPDLVEARELYDIVLYEYERRFGNA